jgi:hypothetical protein
MASITSSVSWSRSGNNSPAASAGISGQVPAARFADPRIVRHHPGSGSIRERLLNTVEPITNKK